jgi:hypothetical protein
VTNGRVAVVIGSLSVDLVDGAHGDDDTLSPLEAWMVNASVAVVDLVADGDSPTGFCIHL